VLWATDSVHHLLIGFSARSGRMVTTVALPRESRLTGVLDQAGNLHLGDEQGWIIVDLVLAAVTADVRFEPSDIGRVYAGQTVHNADGRLAFADDRGQVFVAEPTQPQRPRLIATCPDIKAIGIAAGRLILLSFDGTLTALGAPA
jgi:hypothetical protein